jgi:L-serine deaminase
MSEHGMNFAWQEGYGACSVSASDMETVKRYIANQEKHHRRRTFEDEFIALLKNTTSHLISNTCLIDVSRPPGGLPLILNTFSQTSRSGLTHAAPTALLLLR